MTPEQANTMNHTKFHRRIAAANYWDRHGIDEADGEEVDVEVENPLSAILAIRLDSARYAKLKRLAGKRKMPVTATAKAMLTEALDEPQI